MNVKGTYIFRIMHVANLEFILREGQLTNKFSAAANPDYVGIGETELIDKREDQSIYTIDSNKEYNPSADYLPFYFYWKSIMLYRIQTGHNVVKRAPNEIIYLVYKLEDIINNVDFLFTDGHGYAKMTRWYEEIENLVHLDFKDFKRQDWRNTEDDPDRVRRKQAEFWVRQPLSLEKITGIAVYDHDTFVKVRAMRDNFGSNFEIKVKPNYYYK